MTKRKKRQALPAQEEVQLREEAAYKNRVKPECSVCGKPNAMDEGVIEFDSGEWAHAYCSIHGRQLVVNDG